MFSAPRALLLAAPLALAACASREIPVPQVVKPYRMEIQQGNFISQEMVAQLKPGMSKEQVRFILGTPLVTDIFHADRWDYVYYRELSGGKREQRSLSVVFDGGKLARVIGDLLPREAPQAASKPPAPPKPAAAPAKPAAESAKPAAAPAKPGAELAAPAPEPASQTQAEKKPDEGKKERGFFGRVLDRIGDLLPGDAAQAATEPPAEAPKPAEAPVALEAKPEAAPAPQEEKKPEADKKERGFFGRMLDKIGF